MRTQKITILTIAMVFLVSVNSVAQDRIKGERPSPEELFQKLDTNEDGKIVKEEIEDERMAKRFDKFDANADGEITLDELKASFENRNRRGSNKGKGERLSPEKLFEKLDTNKDGKIVKEEIENERMAKRFDKFDANADGEITLDELQASFENRKNRQP